MRNSLGKRLDPRKSQSLQMSSSSQTTLLSSLILANRSSTALSWRSFSSLLHGADSILHLWYHSWLGFCASAGSSHWAALHHLMEYLAGAPSFKITNRRSKGTSNLLSGYADEDWGNSCSLLESTSGTLMLYNKAPIMWRSKMQKTTALSQRQRLSTMPHLRLALRSCISELFWDDLALLRRCPHQCTRITPRASSGKATSSADGNGALCS
jgi:hypothetical protein